MNIWFVRSEVKTVVNRVRQGQIQQAVGVISIQEQIIPQLQEENMLGVEGECSVDRKELGHWEYDFQHQALQDKLEGLKWGPVVGQVICCYRQSSWQKERS